MVATSLVFAQPLHDDVDDQLNPFERRSCGGKLAERVNEICQERGGHKTYTNIDIIPHIRVRRNIANECCVNKCLDEYIAQSYCNNLKPISGSRKISSETVTTTIIPPTSLRSITTPSTTIVIEDEPLDVTESTNYMTEIIPTKIDESKARKDFIVQSRNIKVDKSGSRVWTMGTVPPEFFKRPMLPSRSRRFF